MARLTGKKQEGHTVCPYSHAAEFLVGEAGRRVVGMLDELLRRWPTIRKPSWVQ